MLADAYRSGDMLGLLSFELTNLKEIHQRGGRIDADAALRQLVERIGRMLRRNELLFRTGADAFALLISRTTPDTLPHLANRLLQDVRETAGGAGYSRPSLDISLGVALAPLHAQAPEAMMLAAVHSRDCARAEGPYCWRMASRWDGEPIHPPAFEILQ